ncbi:MAG: polysaccharide ABC transporter ATP-binding protein [Oculatellaceae cyanobacterium bins.114]|nr:polysaccharide ABC transporter ATP-binding protein [Oculatellaceae cyanobacterium bins.114]
MSDTVIRVENLSKKYIIGHQPSERYTALRDVIANRAKGLAQRLRNPKSKLQNLKSEEFWALKDVSFEVKQGDRVGIIGRNGAGKSTLLKILSRITEPTTGRIKIKGRVASLLEVGTGFHPELTGRENIYLNGAILGMSKAEIKRKFDEIVNFAEIEKFLDTPVKRYSSGMYVRLAFAVAAHLEPEILIVDEVLAVGDTAFQQKCIGKMEQVGRQGRTVLFVSHNMQAIQSLCGKAVLMEAGQVACQGEVQTVVSHYLTSISKIGSEIRWTISQAPGNEEIKLLAIRVRSEDGNSYGVYSSKQHLFIELEFIATINSPALCIGFDLLSQDGVTLFRSYQTDVSPDCLLQINIGQNSWRCTIPASLLNGGIYYLCPRIGRHNMYWIVNLDPVIQFEIILDHGISPLWNSLNGRTRKGMIAPILKWSSMQFTEA